MTQLYLESVEFSNFRIYGESYVYRLPATPGVTLITGGNGLGKTTFFDGVEWALAGSVSRFSDIPVDNRRREQNPLTRIGAPEGSHRVSLKFSDGDPIDRGQGFVPDDTAIAHLLKKADWPEIANLHGYLSITHFLGQASTRRFSVRKPADQWEALKGPAGVDRINALRERLGGQGARLAFSRAIKERTKDLEEANRALTEWAALLAERDRSLLLSTSELALPPAAVRETVDRLATQVTTEVPALVWNAAGATEESESAINRLGVFLRTAEESMQRGSERVEALGRLVSDFENARAENSALSLRATEIVVQRGQTADALAKAEIQVTEADAALATANQSARQIELRAATLARVSVAYTELTKSESNSAAVAHQIASCETTMKLLQEKRSLVGQQIVEATAQREQRRRLNERFNNARQRESIIGRLRHARLETQRLGELQASVSVAELDVARREFLAAIELCETTIRRIEDELRRQDDRTRSMAQAVAIIAGHLHDRDTICPVCETTFAPGRLAELANNKEGAEQPLASQLAEALADQRLQHQIAHQELSDVEGKLSTYRQQSSALAVAQSEERMFLQQFIEAGGQGDGLFDETEVLRVQLEIEALDLTLQEAVTQDTLETALSAAEVEFSAEVARLETLHRNRGAISDTLEAARTVLSQYPEFWNDKQGLLLDLEEQRQINSQEAVAAGERLGLSRKTASDALLTRDRLREQLANENELKTLTDSRLNQAIVRAQELTQAWMTAGMSGEPNASRLAAYRSTLAEQKARISAFGASHNTLLSGYRKWLNDESLREKQREIKLKIESGDASDELTVTTRLTERVIESEKRLAGTQTTQRQMVQLTAGMQDRAEKYAEDVLVPLNATIQRFARALMTWSDESIIYHAEHHATRSELRPGIVRTELDGTVSQLPMNPNLYFSEGQLSALSVSALLAASTTFSWSRWRGLLMDDPLQHNDIIHASAFMDLLRQLVRELKYQVILSTHDSSEAEFLSRKCRSAGIPFSVHELVPHGNLGLTSVAV
ncbi:AAA family ATPase [Rhizobium hidalgonense]|uniref:AAA family ATPase n=1 Tax=Rhizobium hidalgonense TaxID=1538159 RepID=UPI0011066749|nr:AAA family ATPase [Rhizobium hidalgonense]QKK27037.1 AAA family ATPase [Rhizobium hidalgonense]